MTTISGSTFNEALDGKRLRTLQDRVREAMSDHTWWTYRQLVDVCGGSEGGVAARVRDLRNKEGRDVRRRRVPGKPGLHEYRLMPEVEGGLF